MLFLHKKPTKFYKVKLSSFSFVILFLFLIVPNLNPEYF